MGKGKLVIIILSFLAAAVSSAFAYVNAERLVVTVRVPVPLEDIPPSTLITSRMLTTKEVPRALLNEGIYRDEGQLVGKVSTVALRAGRPVFREQALPPQEFRLTDDPSLEVVSIEVAPEYAVGGAVKPGHFICIYRIAVGKPGENDPQALLEIDGAAVERVTCTRVLDVRASRGMPLEERRGKEERQRPMNIVAVGVPHETAVELLRLMGEQRSGAYIAAVTLGPLVPEKEAAR